MSVESKPNNGGIMVNRRGWIAYALLSGGSIAGTAVARSMEINRLSPSQKKYPIVQVDGPSNEISVINTIEESIAFNAIQVVSGSILTRMGLKIGNADLEQVMNNIPHDSMNRRLFLHLGLGIVESLIFTPLREELIFRAIPDALLNDDRSKARWDIGLVTSVFFAAIHNFPKNPTTGKRNFNTKYIPLLQFSGGMFLWKQLRDKGVDHAILAHSAINFSVSPLVMLIKAGEFAVTNVFTRS